MHTHRRADELNIDTEAAALIVSNNQLFNAITEEVDLETVTNQELKEIFFIVRKQLSHLNWRELVTYSVQHLPFGLNQTYIAWEGSDPCISCPDAMIDQGHCYHQGECKAWEIYSEHF